MKVRYRISVRKISQERDFPSTSNFQPLFPLPTLFPPLMGARNREAVSSRGLMFLLPETDSGYRKSWPRRRRAEKKGKKEKERGGGESGSCQGIDKNRKSCSSYRKFWISQATASRQYSLDHRGAKWGKKKFDKICQEFRENNRKHKKNVRGKKNKWTIRAVCGTREFPRILDIWFSFFWSLLPCRPSKLAP